MTFNTYYWHGYVLQDAQLERARSTLATSGGRDATGAFELLLRSDEPAAVGIALDHYHYVDASTRHGSGSPFAPYAGSVRARALDMLRQPPIPAGGVTEEGANHASALGALLNLAEPEDAELITDA